MICQDDTSDASTSHIIADLTDCLVSEKAEFWKWYPYDCNGNRRHGVDVSSWNRLQVFKLYTQYARRSIIEDVKAFKNSKTNKFEISESTGQILDSKLTESKRAVTEAQTAVAEAQKLKVWKRKTNQAMKELERAENVVSIVTNEIDANWKRYVECSCCEDYFDIKDAECDHQNPHFYVLVGLFLHHRMPNWYTAIGGDNLFCISNPSKWAQKSIFVDYEKTELMMSEEWTRSLDKLFRNFHKIYANVQLLCRQCHNDKTMKEFRGLQTNTYLIRNRPQPIVVPGKLSKKQKRDSLERDRKEEEERVKRACIDADRQVRGPSLYANLKQSIPTHDEESHEKCDLIIEAINALPDWAIYDREFQRYILLGIAYLRFFNCEIDVVECLEQKLRRHGLAL